MSIEKIDLDFEFEIALQVSAVDSKEESSENSASPPSNDVSHPSGGSSIQCSGNNSGDSAVWFDFPSDDVSPTEELKISESQFSIDQEHSDVVPSHVYSIFSPLLMHPCVHLLIIQ